MATVLHSHAPSAVGDRSAPRFGVGACGPWLLLSVPAALLAIVGSIAGITVDSVYAQETENWAAQATGQDVANLVVFPAMLAAAALAWRGSLRAYLVWTGLLAASAYTYVIYAFDVHWGRLFLLDVAVLGLSAWSLVGGLVALDTEELKRRFQPSRPTRAAAVTLIVIAAPFLLLWLSIEVPAAVAGEPADELADIGLFTNPVHVLDLALFLPAALVAGSMLLRRRPLGYALVPLVLTTMVAISTGILALTLVSAHRGLDWSPAVLVANVVIGAVEAFVLARLLLALREERSLS